MTETPEKYDHKAVCDKVRAKYPEMSKSAGTERLLTKILREEFQYNGFNRGEALLAMQKKLYFVLTRIESWYGTDGELSQTALAYQELCDVLDSMEDEARDNYGFSPRKINRRDAR